MTNMNDKNIINLFHDSDALLITNLTNIRYLTNFVGAAPEEREAYVMVARDEAFLFTNKLYLEQTKAIGLLNCYIVKLLKSKKPLQIIEISRENPFAVGLAEVLKRSHLAKPQGETLKGIRLGYEENDLTVAEYEKLKRELKGVKLAPTRGRVEELRMIKREDEIENIRLAAKITDECFDFILGKIKPGITESEIAWEIESFFRKRAAEIAFSPIVAFGTHTSQPHYSARTLLAKLQGESLKNQDIALLDFGACVNGYCSDMTRVVFTGKPTDEWKRAYTTVSEAQSVALENIHHNPDKRSREFIRKAGFPPYCHSLGHGVGLAIHEQPRLSYKKEVKLLPSMVVTIEPAIYVEGRYGIRIEDLVLLKKDGVEILSKSPKLLTIL